MRITKLFEMSKLETVDEAVGKLLEFAEYPQILRWFQFPTALVVLSPMLTSQIPERSMSMTGNSVSGFGWTSTTRTTADTAHQSSTF
jgi:hypothetical protein